MEKSFRNEKKIAVKENRKINYNAKTVVERFKAESGTEIMAGAKMMWEGAYMEWAKTADAGFLSPTEAAANWKEWDENPKHPRDWDGPRGYKQLAIPGYDKRIVDFNKSTHSKELQLEQRLGKAVDAARLEKIRQGLGQQHDLHKDVMANRSNLAAGIGLLSSSSTGDASRACSSGAFDSVGVSMTVPELL